jgi:hypothetical protein
LTLGQLDPINIDQFDGFIPAKFAAQESAQRMFSPELF